jgi:glucokinase
MNHPKDSLILGIDLGGTKILTAVIDAEGNLRARDHSITPAAKGPQAVIQAIRESAKRSFEQASMDADGVHAVGIGGGIIIDGRLYTGAGWTAAELGHTTIDVDGLRCNCGNIGCWETLASGTALARRARLKIEEGASTSILEHAGGQIDKVDAEIIQAAAEQGDVLADELISRTGYYLGVGLANLLNTFNPEMIVIGGGLSNIGDRIFNPAYRTARERAYESAYAAATFTRAKLGRNSGVLGAAAYAMDKLS